MLRKQINEFLSSFFLVKHKETQSGNTKKVEKGLEGRQVKEKKQKEECKGKEDR